MAVGRRNIFSVPIGSAEGSFGVLTYQIYRDHPAIHLFWVRFWGEDSSAGPK
jgi:hypothetical protein